MNSSKISPPIVAAVRSPRWRSQIERFVEQLEPSPPVHWKLGFDSVVSFAIAHPSSVLIAELPDSFAQAPIESLKLVSSLCNNPQQCPLLLLGDESTEPWRDILTEAGATATCCSILDFEKVCLQIDRHLENHAISDLSVEDAVAARLPW